MSSLTGSLETRKDCKINGLGAWKPQNNTKSMAWERGGLKTLQNQGLGAWRFQNLTKIMVWEPGGPRTLQKQWFGSLEAPEPYKNNSLGAPPGFQTPPSPL